MPTGRDSMLFTAIHKYKIKITFCHWCSVTPCLQKSTGIASHPKGCADLYHHTLSLILLTLMHPLSLDLISKYKKQVSLLFTVMPH